MYRISAHWVVLFGFSFSLAQGAVSSIQVVGSTNVQSILSYQAPDNSPCSVQVSENRNFQPLVHDVDPVLFPGADSDNRAGSIANGQDRFFVVGKRAVQQAADGRWYSLALQADTLHYFRIQCANDTATGSFRTANVPTGVSYPWPLPQDPQTGDVRWPTVDTADRNQTIIDPNYGTLIRYVTMRGDDPGTNWFHKTFANAAGNNWTNAPASLADDGGAAHYTGSGQDWLALTQIDIPNLATRNDLLGQSIDAIVVRMKASAPDSGGNIDVCLTLNGATCASDIRTRPLDTSEGLVSLGVPPVDTWNASIWKDQLNLPTFGVMIRPSTPGAPVSIQYVDMDVLSSGMGALPENGVLSICSTIKSNGGFHCAFRTNGGAGPQALYWIGSSTGEVRWLGKMIVGCSNNFASFDFQDPNIYYCGVPSGGKLTIMKGTYTGGDVAARPGQQAAMTWVNLTPPPNTIHDLIKQFNSDYDATAFPNCAFGSMATHYLAVACRATFQDSIGWLAVFDLGNGLPIGSGGTGSVVAAAKSFTSAGTRWCGIHSMQLLEGPNWIGWGPKRSFCNSNLGPCIGTRAAGPYSVTLNTDLPARIGSFIIQVDGEPQPYLMDAAVGDSFLIPTSQPAYDLLRIIEKHGSTEWVVQRTVAYGKPQAVPAGTSIQSYCGASNPNDPKPSVSAYWNFLADPNGTDTTNTNWVVESVLAGGHLAQRGDYRIMAGEDGYQVVTPGVPSSWNKPVSFLVSANPKWAAVRAWAGLPDTSESLVAAYQAHPTYENFGATEQGRNNWFVDLIPFIGSPLLTASITPVDGTSFLYKASGTRLHRNIFPTFALCGSRQLKDISPGPIDDTNRFTYCVGGACRPGAGPSDVFINCSGPVSTSSNCGANLDTRVCVADMPPYGQTISQFFLDRSGAQSRALTNGLLPWNSKRVPMDISAAFALPDGKWVLFPSYGNSTRKEVFMVKVPPQQDSLAPPDATKPAPVPITVTPPVDGVRKAVLQYGSTPDLTSTMLFPSCRSGSPCNLTLPARPFDVLYSKIVFQDADGNPLAQTGLRVQISSGVSGPGKPVFSAANVVNSISVDQRFAPDTLVTIYGDRLAECEAQADTSQPLPQRLCQASVDLGGNPAFLLYANPTQLNVLLPSSVPPQQDLQLVVSNDVLASDPVTVPAATVGAIAPAIFTYDDGAGPRALISHSGDSAKGAAVPQSQPLTPGERATLYANSLGPVNPPVADGQVAPTDTPAPTVHPVSVYINDRPQPVLFSGLIRGDSSGAYQVEFQVDPATPIRDGNQNLIWLATQDVVSPRVPIHLQPASP